MGEDFHGENGIVLGVKPILPVSEGSDEISLDEKSNNNVDDSRPGNNEWTSIE